MLNGVGKQSDPPPSPPHLESIIVSPTIIFSEVTATFLNRDQEYCLPFEEQNPVWKNPKQILLSSMSGDPAMLQDLLRPYLCHWLHPELGDT
jgi:hypothetical protein